SGAVIDRRNPTSAGSYVFELNNAGGVTLANLSITGGYDGINVSTNGNVSGRSINFTLQNSVVYNNNNTGLTILDHASANALIQDNVFYGDASDSTGLRDQNTDLYLKGQDPTVLRNQAYHLNGADDNGIYVEDVGFNAVVKDNLVWAASSTGIYVRSA